MIAKRRQHAFVETGPDTTLVSLARKSVPAGDHLWLPSQRRADQSDTPLLTAVAGYHAAGLPFSWPDFHAGQPSRRITLPGYAFERERYWLPNRQLTDATRHAPPALTPPMAASDKPGSTLAPDALASATDDERPALIGGYLLAAIADLLNLDTAESMQGFEAGVTNVVMRAFVPQEAVRLIRDIGVTTTFVAPAMLQMMLAGLPCPGVALRIVDRAGNVLPTGEVQVRTPAVILGYWRQQEATRKALVDGWLSMGDAGYLDDNGYLFLRDRIKDTIIVAGQNVYPAEVENALAAHPAVAEVAVIGVPHTSWGEAVHACVVRHPDAVVMPRQLMLSLKGRIADYKVPTSYEFTDALPRNPSGKVLRRELRERYWQDRPDLVH
jgi:hypothetical protein